MKSALACTDSVTGLQVSDANSMRRLVNIRSAVNYRVALPVCTQAVPVNTHVRKEKLLWYIKLRQENKTVSK